VTIPLSNSPYQGEITHLPQTRRSGFANVRKGSCWLAGDAARPYRPDMDTTANENDKQQIHPLRWPWLVAPPLVPPIILLIWYFALPRSDVIGMVVFYLVPLVCAIWAFLICKRLAGSSLVVLVCLFIVELFLMFIAYSLVFVVFGYMAWRQHVS